MISYNKKVMMESAFEGPSQRIGGRCEPWRFQSSCPSGAEEKNA